MSARPLILKTTLNRQSLRLSSPIKQKYSNNRAHFKLKILLASVTMKEAASPEVDVNFSCSKPKTWKGDYLCKWKFYDYFWCRGSFELNCKKGGGRTSLWGFPIFYPLPLQMQPLIFAFKVRNTHFLLSNSQRRLVFVLCEHISKKSHYVHLLPLFEHVLLELLLWWKCLWTPFRACSDWDLATKQWYYISGRHHLQNSLVRCLLPSFYSIF